MPELVEIEGSPWPVLPPGVHIVSLEEVEVVFATTEHRKWLFSGLTLALKHLAAAGCRTVYLDGSYTTGKPRPGDYDLCWAPEGVRATELPPALLETRKKRQIKATYLGDICPYFHPEGGTFFAFFQTDRYTGEPKGILRIDLATSD